VNKEEKQRIYDAMLIRAWRKDVTVERLRLWLRPYNICILDEDLIRTTSYIPQRVVRFVGIELKPLSDKLFDGDPADDLKILNWLGKSNLRCQKTNRLDLNEKRSTKRSVEKNISLLKLTKEAIYNRHDAVKLNSVPIKRITSRLR
jgi:hypothetical protein